MLFGIPHGIVLSTIFPLDKTSLLYKPDEQKKILHNQFLFKQNCLKFAENPNRTYRSKVKNWRTTKLFNSSLKKLNNTHKAICPNSSCNPSSSSDKSLSDPVDDVTELERLTLLLEGAAGLLIGPLPHQAGWCVFIIANTFWKFAPTEWLGLVDWKEQLTIGTK